MEKVIPLSLLGDNEVAKIVEIRAGHNAKNRLVLMGLVPGKEVKVKHKSGAPILVKIDDSYIGIGYGLAMKVMVKTTTTQKPG